MLDFLHGVKGRVYPVGRLDYHSEGLILLTNDGEFANAITAARSHVPKTYLVKSKGQLTLEAGRAVPHRHSARADAAPRPPVCV